MNSIILDTDSYKCSQWLQYPPNTTGIFSYVESRGGDWPETVFFGLQPLLQRWAAHRITMEEIDNAEAIITAHGEPFNRAGWEHIVNIHGGKLPVVIRAVPEGTVVPTQNVLLTIENTDPECYWLTSYLETTLLRAVWYGTTVATNSYECKKIINEYLKINGDPSTIDFKLHDFGARGVSSFESANIGDAAHLVSFMGTDTLSSLSFIMEHYHALGVAGFSIPASEHSTITSWGKENEVEAYKNMLKQFAKPDAIVACVSDSYDIYEACKIWGTDLKERIVNSGATLVVRPDSGEPHEVVLKCLQILDEHFGHTKNEKGYKVLNHVRVIQGDGINKASIGKILAHAMGYGYSADNIAFGMGGALLQGIDRDTMKFAMKCSAARIDSKWRHVYKDPITDPGKRSKRGRVDLIKDGNHNFQSSVEDWPRSQLVEVFRNGESLNESTFEEIRERAREPFKT